MAKTLLPKPIDVRLHSTIDYGFLLGNLTLPTLLRMPRRFVAMFASFGVIQGILNALTVQPYAVDKLVPFKTHGTIEKSSLPIYVAVPLLLGVWNNARARGLWLAVGAALVTVYNLTDWNARNTGK